MNADDIPENVRQLLDSLPSPELPPVCVSDIIGVELRELREQRDTAKLWKWISGSVAAIAFLVVAANAYSIVISSQHDAKATAELQFLRERLAKLEAVPDSAKIEAKLNDINDLLLTLASDVNDRDEKQRSSILALGKQLNELRKLSDTRWTDAKNTTDALYVLHDISHKETKR